MDDMACTARGRTGYQETDSQNLKKEEAHGGRGWGASPSDVPGVRIYVCAVCFSIVVCEERERQRHRMNICV
jgi:hypothetical protein